MSKPPPTSPTAHRTRGSDFSAGSSGAPQTAPRRAPRAVRAVGWLLLALTAVVLVAAGSIWWWAGSGTSLASTLQRAARYLPADQQLESRDVTGTLRGGGRIGWLRWRSPSLAVEVTDLQLGWQIAPLLRRRLELGTVHAAHVQVTPYTVPDAPPPTPLSQLVLPLQIGVPFKIDVIDWAGAPAMQALGLAGDYRFDGQHHRLIIDSLHLAQGQYSARATLQAMAPMALDATVQGTVQTTVPGSGAALPLTARATVQGTLATAAAQLQAQLQISPATSVLTDTPTTTLPGKPTSASPQAPAVSAKAEARTKKTAKNPSEMQAKVQATLAPWAPQPLLAADATLSAVNLAALWPQAPVTLLQGTIKAGPLPTLPTKDTTAPSSVAPPTSGWAIEADVRNPLAGPWDKGRLPLSALQASAHYDGTRWAVPSASFRTDTSTGSGTAQGQYTPATGALEGEATLRALRPGSLHTALDAALSSALSGSIRASTQGSSQSSTVRFNADIRTAARTAGTQSPTGLRIRQFTAQGSWQPPPPANVQTKAAPSTSSPLPTHATAPATQGGTLQIDQLLLDALDARIEATGLQILPAALSAQGRLRIAAPGISAQAEGRMAPRTGAGNVQLQWADTARTLRWLTALPWVGSDMQRTIQATAAQGAMQFTAQWQGGWQTLTDQLQAASTGNALPPATDGFELQATLGIPQLELTLPAPHTPSTGTHTPATVGLRAVSAELSGNLRQARLTLNAQTRTQTAATSTTPAQPLQASVQTRLSGGLTAAGQWQTTIHALRLQAQTTAAAAHTAPWALELAESITLIASRQATPSQPGKPTSMQVQASAGQARVTGPSPGTATLRWQPAQLTLGAATAGALPLLQTQGTLQGLPMAWVDALGLGEQSHAAGSANAADRPAAPPLLQSMGLATTLVFEGQWNVDTTTPNAPKASASLRRASGDLRILSGDATAVTAVQSSGQGTGAGTATAVATAASQTAIAPGAGTAAGVRQAEISIQAQGEALTARLLWASERAGEINASVSTRLTLNPVMRTPAAPTSTTGQSASTANAPAAAPAPAPSAIALAANAPLEGTVRARLPDVGVWGTLAPPGWRVRGTLDANATLSGTLNAPRWAGTLGADEMAVRSIVDGVDLQGGRLRATLRGNQIDINELHLQGGRGSSARIAGFSGNRAAAAQDGGTLTGSGRINWTDRADGASGLSGIRMVLQAEVKALQVLTRADRQVSVSGPLQAGLEQGQIRLRGQLTVDRATIILPDESAPSLGSDVVVRSAAKSRADQAKVLAAAQAGQAAGRVEAVKPPDIALTLNLGRDFALQGRGITTRLVGELDIRGSTVPGAPPRLTGEVRTDQGRYRAWGQMLDVETGLIRFNGPYNNPSLDILALRPNISVRAGVQVTGSAQAPRVKLYSDPELPDAEKLSWVVLGRSAAGGGAEAAVLQQAALALLGRSGGSGGGVTANIANRLGLDEIGVKGPGAGEDATAAALTFGKRLSQDLYLTYERSLSGTLGTLYIFYDLSRRLTLRGQTGEKSAVDLIYTQQYD